MIPSVGTQHEYGGSVVCRDPPSTLAVTLTVNQTELVRLVAGMRVTVQRTRLSMSSPSGMRHRGLGDERLAHIHDPDVGCLLGVRSRSLVGGLVGIRSVLRDQLAETGDLADLLEKDGRRVRAVTIDTDTCR
jgi:hypothetical protein